MTPEKQKQLRCPQLYYCECFVGGFSFDEIILVELQYLFVKNIRLLYDSRGIPELHRKKYSVYREHLTNASDFYFQLARVITRVNVSSNLKRRLKPIFLNLKRIRPTKMLETHQVKFKMFFYM